MVAFAHSASSLTRHPLNADMTKLACAIFEEVLFRMLCITEVVSLADTIGIRGILLVPLLATLFLVLVLVFFALIIANPAKKL